MGSHKFPVTPYFGKYVFSYALGREIALQSVFTKWV